MSLSLESRWPRVVGQAWADSGYLNRLVTEPGTALAEAGIDVPDGHEVIVLRNTPGRTYLVIPEPPAHIVSAMAAEGLAAVGEKPDCSFAPDTKPDCSIAPEPKPLCCYDPGTKPDCSVAPGPKPDCSLDPNVKPDCCAAPPVKPDCSVA